MGVSVNYFTQRLTEEAEQYAFSSPDREVCGVIFTPLVGLWPSFIPIENTSEDPNAFEFRGMDILKALSPWSGQPGDISMWHSHISEAGPSETDYRMSMLMGSQIFAPPPWRWSDKHYVFTLANCRWWEYQ